MPWADLFDRAPDDVSEDDVRRALAEHRAGADGTDGGRTGDEREGQKGPGGGE